MSKFASAYRLPSAARIPFPANPLDDARPGFVPGLSVERRAPPPVKVEPKPGEDAPALD